MDGVVVMKCRYISKVSLFIFSVLCLPVWAADVRVKDLGRVEQTRERSLIGYGLVIGLAGTGDSARNKVTVQSLKNTLSRFGVEVSEKDISSKNVAAVMVSAELSAYSEVGSRFDVSVSSIGDARSLLGGHLLIAPLKGVDDKIYGFAKGPLTVGGFEIESYSNSYKKNHSTSGSVVLGGTLERPVVGGAIASDSINVYLDEPDYTTATRLVNAVVNAKISSDAMAEHPGKVVIKIPNNINPVRFVSRLENLRINPDVESRVVVNEKTGTIVSGSDVMLGAVSISHGNLKIEVETDFIASQPSGLIAPGDGISSVVVPDTAISVEEERGRPVSFSDGATVSDLVIALNEIDLSTRDIITILQGIKAAGALHAELVIQ